MKSSKVVKIGKVELEIGGKVIGLTLEEAKELRDILKDKFPEKEVTCLPGFTDRCQSYPWRYWEYTVPGRGSVLRITIYFKDYELFG